MSWRTATLGVVLKVASILVAPDHGVDTIPSRPPAFFKDSARAAIRGSKELRPRAVGPHRGTLAETYKEMAAVVRREDVYGRYGFCWPSIDTIASAVDRPRSTVIESQTSLEESRHIIRVPRWRKRDRGAKGPNGRPVWRNRSNLWVIVLRPEVPLVEGELPRRAVVAVARKLRNRPKLIVPTLQALAEAQAAEATGRVWTEPEMQAAVERFAAGRRATSVQTTPPAQPSASEASPGQSGSPTPSTTSAVPLAEAGADAHVEPRPPVDEPAELRPLIDALLAVEKVSGHRITPEYALETALDEGAPMEVLLGALKDLRKAARAAGRMTAGALRDRLWRFCRRGMQSAKNAPRKPTGNEAASIKARAAERERAEAARLDADRAAALANGQSPHVRHEARAHVDVARLRVLLDAIDNPDREQADARGPPESTG